MSHIESNQTSTEIIKTVMKSRKPVDYTYLPHRHVPDPRFLSKQSKTNAKVSKAIQAKYQGLWDGDAVIRKYGIDPLKK